MSRKNLFRQIPAIDLLLAEPALAECPRALATRSARRELVELRRRIAAGEIETVDRAEILEAIVRRCRRLSEPSLRPLVNATGVVLHTNLGRAPIDEELFEEARELATGYCNLEYDLQRGERGDRYAHTSRIFRELFGVEDALVVNNNAAAVFLILNTFAAGKEAVVSRGELVEIGGSFRIPEVMRASGAKLREVGTTNKTHLRDYEEAIGEETAMLMKVHRSNYRIEGFSSEVPPEEIVALASRCGVLDYYDLGSAYLPSLPWGLSRAEPSIFQLLEANPSLLSFSGDKLFGGVQAGIILGKRKWIELLKKNQILRMFRVDKLTLALLERTAIVYLEERYDRIPTLRMLGLSPEELESRASKLRELLPLTSRIRASRSYVGGGTMPGKKIPTVVLELEGDAGRLERHFRSHRIIGRIEAERFVLDLRTVEEGQFPRIVRAAESFVQSGKKEGL